jgi:AcrR family transcriptional regulator
LKIGAIRVTTLTAAQQRLHAAALKLFAERGVTQVNVRELAHAAGVARGTVYNNLSDPARLFDEVAAQFAEEMNDRIVAGFDGITDPAQRLANGIRLYIRRAHEEPHWGRFLTHFGCSNASLQQIWKGQPALDLMEGLQTGRYHFQPEQLASVIGLLGGSVLGAIFVVLEGFKTWRDAGSDTAELVLVSLGVSRAEARALASASLPASRPSTTQAA